MKTTAEIVTGILLITPIAEMPMFQLEQKLEQLHGANLYAICSNDSDGSAWIEYLIHTITDMIDFRQNELSK